MSTLVKVESLSELSATQIAADIAHREFTAEAVARDCLDRIQERGPLIRVWVAVDAEQALRGARLYGRSSSRGPLHKTPRIGVCRTHLWDTAQPESVAALEDAAYRLAAAGAEVRDVVLSSYFEHLTAHRSIINSYERVRSLASKWCERRDHLSPQMLCTYEDVDVLLTPAAAGEAPAGLDHAGAARFQELWALLQVPTLTLPTQRGPNNLPVGIQLVAPRYQEALLFAVARWTEQCLRPR